MSRYLSALKISEKGIGDEPKKPKQPTFASSLGSLGTRPPPFEINQAANDDDKLVNNVAIFRWLIHFSDRESVEVTFTPEATHGEVLERYPGAVAAEPVPVPSRRTAANGEAVALRQLVTMIYQDDSDDDRNEALAMALADPENALACYRALADERGLTLAVDDDRRTCRQCANLTYSGACSVASPGGALSAVKGYRPGALFQEQLHRCGTFNERTI